MKYAQWTIAPSAPHRREALEAAGISPLLSAALCARGIDTPQAARDFLSHRDEALLPTLDLTDMDKAAARVRRAVERGETVAVYGDYDVDGITSACLLTDFLHHQGCQVLLYIPDRLEEGYGLNCEAVLSLKERGVGLIVTVDCGITAVEETDLAGRLGMDVVITDHHACKDTLPAAAAVVDPHREDCPYPFKGLAGVGVALKLAMAVAGPEGEEGVLEDYCDLAAIGTIADVMPMTGENRVIVRRGLAALEHPRRPGLAALIRESGLEGKGVTTTAIGYTLAPRINASGRLGRAQTAAELLLTRDEERARELAQELCQLNRERQSIEGEIFQQSLERLERAPQEGAVVLSDTAWHQGVVGIVASRLAERYACPVFMVCLSDGMGKGSCRSWGGVNLFETLQECSDLLEGFGGHALAAGFTVRQGNIPALAQRLHGLLSQGEKSVQSALMLDAQLRGSELTVEAVEDLEALEPCGSGNPRPAFALGSAVIVSLNQVGRGRHLKLRLEKGGVVLDAIWFSVDAAQLGLVQGERVDVAFYPQINEFRGVRTVQLQVIDLRPSLTRAQCERAAYEKYSRGEALSPQEARLLTPSREEFAALWRYLRRLGAPAAPVSQTLTHLAKGAARGAGQRESRGHTMVCLDVLEERGLLRLTHRGEVITLAMNPVEGKTDLEASPILRRLREMDPGD